jgi:class 3 adenylate cyclase
MTPMPGDDGSTRDDALPVGTLTFVLTDIEGSTERWDDEPAAMAGALHQHDTLVAAAIAAHGGRLVKSKGEGDSTFSVFADPTAAVSAAEAIRDTITAASWPTAHPIRVRVGVLTGVAELRDGDYYGAAVNRAARVRSLARGGEVLLAASTYTLIADSLLRNRVVEDRGEHELRGLQRPERVYALHDATAVPVVPARRPRRTRAPAIAGVGALVVVVALGALAWSRHADNHPAAAANAAATTTMPVVVSNKPSVEIASIELVSKHAFIRYEVSGVFARVKIPPYQIRVLARAPNVKSTWLWSPPATVEADGHWSGALDVPTGPSGAPAQLKVSAIAIISGPVSGVTVHVPGSTTYPTVTLPPSPLEQKYDHDLTTRGPSAPGVIAVSTGHTAG